ncbi:cysteine desulfurase NifS [Paenibacillus sp. DS2015]|uniref:IscS subfamily cysteine desulfurase n=1 Tax=Paenibacillus sp. DS2015 TaxID=3373917 RepID=UPI003D1DE642
MIYLDYNATTPVDKEVADAIIPYIYGHFGNPSSSHTLGTQVKSVVVQARKQVADFLNCAPTEVLFTSGGSEANNTVIKGVAHTYRDKGKHIIISSVEHPAVIQPCQFLEQMGYRVTYLPVDRYGMVNVDDVRQQLTDQTILVSVMHSNNETGTIQPIKEISKCCREHGVLFHTDASQSAGKVPLDVEELGVDFLTIAGHKLYAPKGIGALYIRDGINIEPLIHGAGHEQGRRAGTENTAYIVGLGKACEIASDPAPRNHVKQVTDYFYERLTETFGDRITLNGHPEKRLPNTLNISFMGAVGHEMIASLADVAASTGSACHAGETSISPVLKAMNVSEEVGQGAIRFSLGRYSTTAEVDTVIDELKKICFEQIEELDPSTKMLIQNDYTSATVVSTATNFIMNRTEPFTHTYRTYIRLRECGLQRFKFWHSNAIDSTWDNGGVASASDLGGEWRIESAFVGDGGVEPTGDVVVGTQVPITFEGQVHKTVLPGEEFWSDEVHIDIPEGHYLVFTWAISTTSSGKTVPYNTEQMLVTAYDTPGDVAQQVSSTSFQKSENLLVLPSFIGYNKQVEKQLLFFGDSITQGVRTGVDNYEYWVARIADGLGASVGVWNIGSGWARAYDAVDEGPWLNKAQQGNEVVIALGVNDLDIGKRTAVQLITELTRIVSTIKNNNPWTSIILCTVSPFNFNGAQERAWREVNEQIRTEPPVGVDRVFDLAEVLSQDAPDDHLVKSEYMSSTYDPHPNGTAGKAIAEVFLKWYS